MTTLQTSRFASKSFIPPTKGRDHQSRRQAAAQDDWTGQTEKFLSAKPEPGQTASQAAYGTSQLAENFRHGGWMPFRKKVHEALQTTPGLPPRRVSAFACCGSDAYVEHAALGYEHKTDVYRIRSTKCHDRFCVPCSNERSHCIRTVLLEKMHGMQNMSLITLTLLHTKDSLPDCLNRITAAFKALRNSPLWKKRVKGGAAIIETKVGGTDGDWHCHYHILAECAYMPQKELSDLWLKITGDSYVVDIRRVGAISGAVQYITKYVTKAADSSIVNSPRHLREAIAGFTGRRLVTTFGSWRGVQLSENPTHADSTQIPDSEWRVVGSLDEILQRAAAGEPDALRIARIIAPHKLRASPGTGPPGECTTHLFPAV